MTRIAYHIMNSAIAIFAICWLFGYDNGMTVGMRWIASILPMLYLLILAGMLLFTPKTIE